MAAAAAPTYTLDFVNDTVVINGVANINPESKRPLGALYDLSGNPYVDTKKLIEEQKTWNYLDALKDGTNKFQLDGLGIYEGIQLPFSALHPHENNLLERNKTRILRTTWLKTKKNSKMNLINAEFVFWEAGLGYEPFIQSPGGKAKEIVTFGSYIDPLTKPGTIWPPPNYRIEITSQFMNTFGFGLSSLWAITKSKDLVTKSSGNAFEYEININCGDGCNKQQMNKCKLEHNPATATKRSGIPIDKNNVYFKGNEAKNALVNNKQQPVTTADKTKLIVAKGWGDKVQVMLYYMFYYIVSKNTIMITCDLVVFCFCMILEIPCVYTGVYDRPVKIPHNERNDLSVGGSFFSILHFKPGSPEDNARMNYDNTITNINAENKEFIDNIAELITNFMTDIEIGSSKPMTFQQVFYQQLYDDMMTINAKLESERGQIPADIDKIVEKTQSLKKMYLIVPMFKYTGKNKIRFLQTKWYTADKGITLDTIIGRVKDNNSFLQYAKTNHDSKYGTNPNPAPPVKGGGNKEDTLAYRKAEEEKKRIKWSHDVERAQRVLARQAKKDDDEKNDTEYNRYKSNNRLKLGDDRKGNFPRRDVDPKFFRSCQGDMNDITDEYIDEKVGSDLFVFDDKDDQNMAIDVQHMFDIEMLSAIDEIASLDENSAEYAASHENVNQRENLKGGRQRNATRRRYKGGAYIDETLFETLYTLYVYRAQYDIELDTHDRSINMKVLSELYNDYPKSEIQPNRNNTRRRVKGGPLTGAPMHTYTIPVSQLTGSRLTGMTTANMRKQSIARYAQTHKRVNTPFHNNSRSMVRTIGGRITRRKKRNNRTRK